MNRLTPLIAAFALLILADTTFARTPEHVCGMAYDTSSLKIPTCVGSNVTIVSQDSHFSTESQAVRDKMLSLGFDNQIMAFFEGDLALKHPSQFTRGTESREAKALAATSLLPILQALSERQKIPDGAHDVSAQRIAQLAFGEMVGLWPEITIELSRSSRDSAVTQIVAKKISTYFVKPENRETDSVTLASLRSADAIKAQPLLTFGQLPDLVEFAMAWTNLARTRIKNVSGLEFLNSASDQNILGQGRSILFTRSVLAGFCEAAKSKTPVWITVGSGHADELSCLLRAKLPQSTQVQIVSSAEFTNLNQNWVETFRTSPEIGRLKTFASERGLEITSITPIGSQALLNFNREINRAEKLIIKGILRSGIYTMNDSESFPTQLTVELALIPQQKIARHEAAL